MLSMYFLIFSPLMFHTTTFLTLLSVVAVSAVSLSGVLLLFLHQKLLRVIISPLVSFSTGALLGDVFLHMLPEMTAEGPAPIHTWLLVLFGVILSFILEKFIHWHHCHDADNKEHHHHPVGIMNLVGDFMHNGIDGLLIAGSYMIDTKVGVATTIAVIFHEIPQEIGDIGVLLYSGFSKSKAFMFNGLTALSSVLAAVVVLSIGKEMPSIPAIILPLAAGNFVYIAGSDLIPELHKETNVGVSLWQLFGLIAGIGCMAALLMLE